MASKKNKTPAVGRPQSLPMEKRTAAEAVLPAVPNDQLRRENEDLRRQLRETKQMTTQLLSETANENYGHRRVLLLKAQLYQTERQLLLLQDGMARRTGALWEAENILQNVKSQCQSFATTSESPAISKADASVPRSQLFRLIEDVEKARSGIFRRLQRDEETSHLRSFSIPNSFSSVTSMDEQTGDDRGVDVIDVLTGKKPMLHLKRAAELESEVFSCHEEVVKLAINLSSVTSSRFEEAKSSLDDFCPSILLSRAVLGKLSEQTDRTKKCLERLGNSLLESSILVPLSAHIPRSRSSSSAPTKDSFPPSTSSSLPGPIQLIDARTILSKFPKQTIAKSRLKEVTTVLQSYAGVCETQRRVDALAIGLLREELNDMARLFEIQNEFVTEVIEMAGKSYDDFYAELTSKFLGPIDRLLTSFEKIETEPTEENLRFFLLVFRENYGAVLALSQYLRQQEQSQLQAPNDPFLLLRYNFREKIQTGLNDLTLKRESRAAQMLARRSESDDVRTSFINLCVAG